MGRIQNFLSGKRLDTTSPPPYLLEVRSSKVFILSTVCVAVFTDMFLYSIIVPVIPFAISSRAGVPQSSVQSWTSILLAVYGGALLVLSPIAGWYADRSSSRRVPLLFGLLALGGATVMLCLARSLALLVVGRILQGFAAAIVWTVGTALIVDTVGQREIGQSLGYVSIAMSVSILVGPLLGGIVYDQAGYYAVYYMAFGLIAVDIFLRLVLIEKKIARQWTVDEQADTEPISDVKPASDQGHTQPNTHIEPASDHDSKGDEKPEAIEPPDSVSQEPARQIKLSKWPPVLTLLKSRRLLAALWGCVVQGSQMTAFDSVAPLFTQELFHFNSIGAGLVFLAIMVPSFLSPFVGWASDHYGPRWLATIGFIFSLPFWVLLRLVTHDTLSQKVLLCALFSLIGVSLTLVMPPLMAEITYVVEAKEKQSPGCFGANGAYAQAYGLFVTAFAAGTLIGPLMSGYIKDAAGWGTMTWAMGLLSLAGAVPCFIWTGGLITRVNAKSADERAIEGRADVPIGHSKEGKGESIV